MAEKRPDPLLVAIDAAATMLSISPRKLSDLAKSGAIPVVRIGRSVRFDVRDLVAFVDTQKAMTQSKDGGAP